MANVISKTGQLWKIKVSLVVLLMSGLSMAYGLMNIDKLANESFFYFVGGGSIAGLLSFVFASAAIKCPSSGSKWFWSAVSGKGDKEWLNWLFSLSSCPKCGEPKGD